MKRFHSPYRFYLIILISILIFSGCAPVTETSAHFETASLPPGTPTISATDTPEPIPVSPTSPSTTGNPTVYLPLVVTPLQKTNQIYWGAYIAGNIYGYDDVPPWDMRPVDTFEAHAGKKISILHWGRRWYQFGKYYGFDAALMDTVRQHGALSLLDWTSRDYDVYPEYNQPTFTLSSIINGVHDDYIRTWATDAKNWGHPFFLRFNHEMNGDWYPWSEQKNGNHAGEFVQAWRHVHDIFTQVGATNVTWVWCPNIEYEGTIPLEELYPGDNYVDWTCIDGYNWGTNPARNGTWQTFNEVYKATYDHILQIAPNKPMMIGEISASEFGGSKPDWIRDVLEQQLPNNYPAIKALVWFNVNADNMDWVIETSPESQAAFAEGIGSVYYTTGPLKALDSSPIPPP